MYPHIHGRTLVHPASRHASVARAIAIPLPRATSWIENAGYFLMLVVFWALVVYLALVSAVS